MQKVEIDIVLVLVMRKPLILLNRNNAASASCVFSGTLCSMKLDVICLTLALKSRKHNQNMLQYLRTMTAFSGS